MAPFQEGSFCVSLTPPTFHLCFSQSLYLLVSFPIYLKKQFLKMMIWMTIVCSSLVTSPNEFISLRIHISIRGWTLIDFPLFEWLSHIMITVTRKMDFPNSSAGKESACNAGDTGDAGSLPGLGRSPGGGNGNPLQYSCLKNPKDRRAWWVPVQRLAKSQTWLSKQEDVIKLKISR